MESNLVSTTIADIALEMGDAPFGSNLKNSDYTDAGVLVVQGRNVTGRTFSWSIKRHVSIEKYNSIPRSHCFVGDLIFPKVGTIGKVGRLSGCEGYDKYILSTNTMRLSVDPNKANPLFVYYYFTWNKTVNLIKAMNSKSVQPVFNYTSLKKFPIHLPERKSQDFAAKVLDSIDNKIELNQQTNQTLEQIGQALFKSWFVNFDPVIDNALAAGTDVNDFPETLKHCAVHRKQAQQLADFKPLPDNIRNLFPSEFVQADEPTIGIRGWVPKGWDVKSLSNLLEVKYGKDHKKLNEGMYPVYGSGGLMRNAEKFLYEGESVLIPRKGTLTNLMYVNEKFWTVDTMFYTIPKLENVAKFTFYHLKTLDFTAMNVGSAVPSMTTKVLNALKIITPSPELFQKFDEIIGVNNQKVVANEANTQQLEKLRDTLLPKLISGEITINKEVT
ncbi:MAG: restriction endonuclease subunit S [Cognaticolwellia sp.]